MASADRASECSVCFDIFLNPKLLPCRHSYCEKCIHELAKGSSKVQCPLCKSFCDVDQIVHDFQTENFVQAFQELEKEFDQRLAAATASSHPEPSAPPEHIIKVTKKCELCNDNSIAFWCVDCEQWMCTACKKIHLNTKCAKNHRIEQLSKKNKEVESSLQTEINGLQIKIDEFNKHIKTLQAEKKNTQDLQIKILKQSKELRAQVILEVNNKFNRVDQDILKGTEDYVSLLERNISKHHKQVSKLENKYQAFLTTIKKKDPKLAIDGVSEVEQAKKLVKNTRSPDMCIRSITIKLQRLQEWSASAVKLDINGGGIAKKDQATLTSPSLGLLSSKQWKYQQSVEVPNSPHCLRNVGNLLYQCHGNGITVYDTNLKQIKNIRKGDMCCVYDVCDMSNGDLVVAADNGLYHTKINGEPVKQIITGSFTGVVRHHNRYYAANSNTATVHVYEHAYEWKQCQSFSVNASTGFIITLRILKNLLYACLAGDHRIDIFSLDGHIQSSTGSRGSGAAGQLRGPFLCATDAAGAVLIADQCNNRLQLLSVSGQWSIVQLQSHVELPYGACIMNDTLFVNKRLNKSLHSYKLE